MHNTKKTVRILAGALVMLGASLPATAVDMSFFITSAGPGNGANLGGLEGADRHCETLAATAGAGKRTWRAYLSTQAAALNDTNVVHARDRIGTGPWFNAKGVLIARNVDELHSPHSNLTKATLLDEKGQMVNGRTEKPNRHDILTGSRPDGTAFPPSPPFHDMTCGNWTKGGDEGMAMTGHHDRAGPTGDAWATSWNSAHPTRGGCSQKALQSTGGDGLFYCFAEK
ncbi:hypothetical protein GPA27_01360 [Aromatoleum toluolicum]|uniref:Lectin n=1 Tax=Aromatoleum toluolicum TaxID=90060 RepID=A0ABX1N9T5_9RHOO|nr:hypothetical protein [Aromatoleum toluolicum]NMF96043.1 hypothetical protein [Aromatoleum toluolicum]